MTKQPNSTTLVQLTQFDVFIWFTPRLTLTFGLKSQIKTCNFEIRYIWWTNKRSKSKLHAVFSEIILSSSRSNHRILALICPIFPFDEAVYSSTSCVIIPKWSISYFIRKRNIYEIIFSLYDFFYGFSCWATGNWNAPWRHDFTSTWIWWCSPNWNPGYFIGTIMSFEVWKCVRAWLAYLNQWLNTT